MNDFFCLFHNITNKDEMIKSPTVTGPTSRSTEGPGNNIGGGKAQHPSGISAARLDSLNRSGSNSSELSQFSTLAFTPSDSSPAVSKRSSTGSSDSADSGGHGVLQLPERMNSLPPMPNHAAESILQPQMTTTTHQDGHSASIKQTRQAQQMPYEHTLELYRQNAKKSHDPYVQLEFAKYLIQIAESIAVTEQSPRDLRKTQQSLLQEGIKWVKRLSTTGLGIGRPAYAEAQYFLAECYGNGLFGLDIDYDKAFALYVQASKQSHPAATYRAAVCYEMGVGSRKDHNRACQFYRKAAALGDVGAMFKLAMILLNGSMNTPKNDREGFTWLKRAASKAEEGSCPESLHELASLYEKGSVSSVIADLKYARELYTKAAQLNYAPSQFKLGFSYEYGQMTCEIDARRSIAWYTRAAEQGHVEAELALSGWYLTGSQGVLEQNDIEAFLWAKRAADKAFDKAEYALGYYYECGIGAAINLGEAYKWYSKAAAQGNERAKARLTDIKSKVKLQKKSNGCVIM